MKDKDVKDGKRDANDDGTKVKLDVKGQGNVQHKEMFKEYGVRGAQLETRESKSETLKKITLHNTKSNKG